VSGQLEAEIYACCMSRVYVFGPAFRAERSHTTRHLAEFWMVEPEIAFIDSETNIGVAEDFVKYITKHVMENCSEDMEFCNKYIETGIKEQMKKMIDSPFGRVTYTEAVEILQKKGFSVTWGEDLAREHERYHLKGKKQKKGE